jgi:hypothetical protein
MSTSGKEEANAGLEAWTIDDFNFTTGLPKDDIDWLSKEVHAYDKLATGMTFGQTYAMPSTEESFIDNETHRPRKGTQAISPFARETSVAGDWEQEGYLMWGGQPEWAGFGPDKYTSYMANLLHHQLLALISRTQADDQARASQLKRIAESSQMVFAWFARLFDKNGTFIDTETTKCQQRKNMVKDLFAQMIFGGKGSFVNSDGSMKVAKIIDLLTFFKKDYCSYMQNCDVLGGIITEWEDYLGNTLGYKGEEDTPTISFLPWAAVIQKQRKGFESLHDALRELYAGRTNPDAKKDIDLMAVDYIEHGKQMAAFFGTFYYITLFWDKFFSYGNIFGEPPTPGQDLAPGMLFGSKMNDGWTQYTFMLTDYAKCTTGGDPTVAKTCEYEILSQLPEVTTNLATWIGGYMLKQFDGLMRSKRLPWLLSAVDTAFPLGGLSESVGAIHSLPGC